MGSFIVPCFATNQSISEGDACRLVPLIQQSSYKPVSLRRGEDEKLSLFGNAMSTSYVDTFWTPAGAFIVARYADFGRFKLKLDPLMRGHVLHLFDQLLRTAYVTEPGEHERHDPPFDLPTFLAANAPKVLVLLSNSKTRGCDEHANADCDDVDIDEELFSVWNYMWDAVYKRRVFVSYHGKPRLFAFGALHERAYQALAAHEAADADNENSTKEPRALLQRILAQARADLVATPLKEGNPLFFEGWRIADTFRKDIGYANRQSGHLTTRASHSISIMCVALAEKRIGEEELIERLIPFLRDQQVIGALNDFNLRFSPIVTGDEDYLNVSGLRYAEFVARVGHDVKRDRQVQMFGPFWPYAMQVAAVADMDAIVEKIKGWDAAIDTVELRPAGERFTVTFRCTLELGDLREALRDEGTPMMAETLVSAAAVTELQ